MSIATGIRWIGTRQEIIGMAEAHAPGAAGIIDATAALIPWCKRQIDAYQAPALYAIARGHDHPEALVIEVGTALGYSAAVIAQAMPSAVSIITLNPKPREWPIAHENLRPFYPRLVALQLASADYMASAAAFGHPPRSFIFIDGDHRAEAVRHDMGWFNFLAPGGLILFHDYSPAGSARACPDVYDTLNAARDDLGRDFDVLVASDDGVGMAGWVRRDGEVLHAQHG